MGFSEKGFPSLFLKAGTLRQRRIRMLSIAARLFPGECG
jgi:hypothetical protein